MKAILLCFAIMSLGIGKVMAQFEAEDSDNILTVSNPTGGIKIVVNSISKSQRVVIIPFLKGKKLEKRIGKANDTIKIENQTFDRLKIKRAVAIIVRFKRPIEVIYDPPKAPKEGSPFNGIVRSATIKNTGNSTTTATVTSL